MRSLAILVCLAALAAPPVLADPPRDTEAADAKAGAMVETSKQVYGPKITTVSCAKEDADEIVVCLDRPKNQRVQSSPPDPNTLEGRRALDGGIPRAPQFDRGYCKECPHFGSVPPPVYYIDVKALPAAPAGSDADRIAKGEIRAP
jgi:hypothetical protein